MSKGKDNECCPQFDPSPWHDKEFIWDSKRFIKDKVFTIFNIPINFGQVMTRIHSQLSQEGAECLDWLCLSDHTSKWNMDIYLAVDKEVVGANNVTLSGRFYSQVYEGDFKQTGVWCQDFEQDVNEKGMEIKKWYMWYTTCPKCAKKYGKNYVVVMAEVK